MTTPELLALGFAGVVAICAGHEAARSGYPATGAVAICAGLLMSCWALLRLAVEAI